MTYRLKPGYTFIEFLLYIAIASVLLLTMTSIVFELLDYRFKTGAIMEVTQNGRSAIDRISIALQNATAITSPTNGASSTMLVLQMPATSTNPTIFAVTGNVLVIKEGSSATTSLTADESQIVSAHFRNLTATGTLGTVRIDMTVSSTNPNLRQPLNFGEVFYLTMNLRRHL